MTPPKLITTSALSIVFRSSAPSAAPSDGAAAAEDRDAADDDRRDHLELVARGRRSRRPSRTSRARARR